MKTTINVNLFRDKMVKNSGLKIRHHEDTAIFILALRVSQRAPRPSKRFCVIYNMFGNILLGGLQNYANLQGTIAIAKICRPWPAWPLFPALKICLMLHSHHRRSEMKVLYLPCQLTCKKTPKNLGVGVSIWLFHSSLANSSFMYTYMVLLDRFSVKTVKFVNIPSLSILQIRHS